MEVNHGCFSGSEALFDSLRLVWSDVAGYGVNYAIAGPNISYDLYTDEDCLGEWPDGAPDDPLVILLTHFESKGRIKVSHAPYLADRLEELESRMIKLPGMTYWMLLTQQFVRGLRTAASYKQDVVFS